jgi:hypothetical protein
LRYYPIWCSGPGTFHSVSEEEEETKEEGRRRKKGRKERGKEGRRCNFVKI